MHNVVSSISAAAIVILLSASFRGCGLFSSQNDDCEATMMATTKEPVIYLCVNLPTTELANTFGGYYLANSTKLMISGSIEKEYCSGKRSGLYTFNPTLYPAGMSADEMESGVDLPQPYQYKFTNDLDKLIIIISYEAYFSDGKIFETGTSIYEVFYEDILFDVHEFYYYVEVDFFAHLQLWYPVSP